MEPTRQQILNSIESLFIRYDQEGVTYKLKDGDGEKGVAYLGYKLYKGIFEDFKKCLRAHHIKLGSISAIEHLMLEGDKWDESFIIREFLITQLHERHGLVIPKPPQVRYEPVINGVILQWRKVVG